jgi:arylsulfatase A-like enzyme
VVGSILITAWFVAHLEPEPTPSIPTGPVGTSSSNPLVVSPGSGVFTNTAPTESIETRNEAICPGCDVLLITLCSLRRDHVGAYGNGLGLTPHLDALAKQGIRFDSAYAASPFTLASLTSVLTGRFPATHGVMGWDRGLVKNVPTLPEVLGYYGYKTAGFTIDAASGFRPDYGLDRGFQHLEITPAPSETPDGRRPGQPVVATGASAVPAARWIEKQEPGQPLFVMFHSRTAHFPFLVSDSDLDADSTGIHKMLFESGGAVIGSPSDVAMPGMSGGTRAKGVVDNTGGDPLIDAMAEGGPAATEAWRSAYAQAVARADKDVGVLLEAIKSRERPTLIIAVADHGESINDHGEMLHGDAYFDGVVHVPLVISLPGQDSKSSKALVSHVDLMPTILDLVGATEPAEIDGISLAGLIQNQSEAVRSTAFVEGGVARANLTQVRGAVISPPWALLRQDRACSDHQAGAMPRPGEPHTCLFHLDEDPEQSTNLATKHTETVEHLLAIWSAFRTARAGQIVAPALRLDPVFVELLQKTGYDFHPETE